MNQKNSGFTLIEAMIAIAIMAILASIAIPDLTRARRSANEASAISSLRTLVSSQAIFYEGDAEGDGVYDYATSLRELESAGFIDDVLATGQKSGYCFNLFSRASTTWHSHADPITRGTTGDRSFYIDETGALRHATSSPAGPASSPIGDSEEPDERSISTDHEDGEPPSCNRGVGGPNIDERMSQYFEHVVAGASKFMSDDLLNQALGAAKAEKIQRLVLTAMDVNQDGALNFDETLHMNVLGLARKIMNEVIFVNPPKDEDLGKDESLVKDTDWFLRKVKKGLDLGAANETEFPNVPIEEMITGNTPNNSLPSQ